MLAFIDVEKMRAAQAVVTFKTSNQRAKSTQRRMSNSLASEGPALRRDESFYGQDAQTLNIGPR